MSVTNPTTDDALGLCWWNHLTEHERREWMRRAGDTGIAADAWECFKRHAPSTGPDAITSLARALRLLSAASPDWQLTGPSDGTTPLHWPAAVAAAQMHIEHALRLIERA